MEAELKAILKTAKETLKNKDYKEVIKLCKSVIDKDKENYFAWVLTGAAAQELGSKEQSLAAYQRAIQSTPKQAPAWQGLAQLYEKNNMTSELTSVYSELRKIFENDPIKFYDYSFKYANSLALQSKFSQAVNIYNSLLKAENKEKDLLPLIERFSFILADPTINDQPSEVYFDLLEKIKSIETNEDVAQNIVRINENALGAMIREDKPWNLIEKECQQILTYSQANEKAITVLLQIYTELLIYQFNINEEELSKKINALVNNSVTKPEVIVFYSAALEAIKITKLNLDQQSLVQYKELLEKIESVVLTSNANRILLTYLQNFYYSYVCDHVNLEKSIQTILKDISQLKVKELREHLKLLFNFNLAKSYYLQHQFTQAIDLFQKTIKHLSEVKNLVKDQLLDDIKMDVNRYLIECYLQTENENEASNLLKEETDTLHENIISILMKYHSGDLIDSYKLSSKLANEHPENYDCNFLLAKSCYSLLEKKSAVELDQDEIKNLCFMSNIKAIKLCPYRWEPIYCLGKYYKYLIRDHKKSLKCFQKAYELGQNLNLCGLELVDSLIHEKEDEIAFNLLKKAIDEIENCKWASLRLGIIYLKKNEPNEAIRLFYNVIRNDPSDYNMWECLADAYLKRGSLTAALKSFNKSIELNPESHYAYYQIAHIKQTLNLYEQAIIDYYTTLNKITNHVPTLKGLGETYYLLAKDNVSKSTDEKYLEYMESSIKCLTKAICLRKDLCCVWKILGDCCLIIKHYPHADTDINVPKSLIEKNFTLPESDVAKTTKLELLKLAEDCYRICCKLKPESAFFWYDLGLSYFYQYSSNLIVDSNLITITKSKECIINAINLQPDNFYFWNTLGILYATNELNRMDMAQHCFIKSIKINDSNAITWTNLGVFYLILNEFPLAHECFKKSQAIDPEYANAWIGQALIAETVEMEECIDLYRHAVELKLHTESLYGYARIVCMISTNLKYKNQNIYKDYITFLNAIPLSSDCIVKYCDRITTNPDAFFLAGVLFEQLSLPLTAIQYYEKVFELSGDESNEVAYLARRAYARLLCGQKQYEAALIQYKHINVKDSIEDLFGLARVFYQLGKYQQCCKIFENALPLCKEDETSIVYTAMGMAQSKYNIQEAVTNFFKSFQSKVICIQSLFALCSIGLLKNDMKLINAVFKELDNIDDPKYRFDIVKLKSIYFCLQKDFGKAIRFISKYIHQYPDDSKSWIELCLCLKRAKSFDLALIIGHVIFITNTQANLTLYECIQYLLIQKLKKQQFNDDKNELLKMFQKTLHMFPANLSSWNTFSEFLSLYDQVNSEKGYKNLATQIDLVLSNV